MRLRWAFLSKIYLLRRILRRDLEAEIKSCCCRRIVSAHSSRTPDSKNNERRTALMTYESLADGGFISGTMLGSGGFMSWMKPRVLSETYGHSRDFIITNPAANAVHAAKVPDGWKKCFTGSNMDTDICVILISLST